MIDIEYSENIPSRSEWIDEYDVEIIHDLHRTWNGCMIGYEGNMWVVDYVRSYEGEVGFKISCTTSDLPSRIVSMSSPLLEIEYPKLGYYNLPTTTIYMYRKISRQWKQGCHINTVGISAPFKELIEHGFRLPLWSVLGVNELRHGVNFHYISSINLYHATYPSYTEATLSLQEEDKLSVALSSTVALALHPINGEVHILYNNTSVGIVDEGKVVIKDAFFWLKDTLAEVIPL